MSSPLAPAVENPWPHLPEEPPFILSGESYDDAEVLRLRAYHKRPFMGAKNMLLPRLCPPALGQTCTTRPSVTVSQPGGT